MRMCLTQTLLSEDLQVKIQLIFLIHEYVAWAQPSIIECRKAEIQGMDASIQQNKDQQVDSGMVAAIQSKESCNKP